MHYAHSSSIAVFLLVLLLIASTTAGGITGWAVGQLLKLLSRLSNLTGRISVGAGMLGFFVSAWSYWYWLYILSGAEWTIRTVDYNGVRIVDERTGPTDWTLAAGFAGAVITPLVVHAVRTIMRHRRINTL